jgi:hypothetical protein
MKVVAFAPWASSATQIIKGEFAQKRVSSPSLAGASRDLATARQRTRTAQPLRGYHHRITTPVFLAGLSERNDD